MKSLLIWSFSLIFLSLCLTGIVYVVRGMAYAWRDLKTYRAYSLGERLSDSAFLLVIAFISIFIGLFGFWSALGGVTE
jgi:hypothetical protein